MDSYNAWYENIWFLEKSKRKGPPLTPPLNLTTNGA